MVNAHKVEYEPQRITGRVSFVTFKLHSLQADAATLPAYKHHLREMVVIEDPIRHLELEAQLRQW